MGDWKVEEREERFHFTALGSSSSSESSISGQQVPPLILAQQLDSDSGSVHEPFGHNFPFAPLGAYLNWNIFLPFGPLNSFTTFVTNYLY